MRRTRCHEVPSIGVVQFMSGLDASRAAKIRRRARILAWTVTALVWSVLAYVLSLSL